MRQIHVLHNPIRSYHWGSYTALAELLGQAVPSAEPQAELWMGAHPMAPSRIERDGHTVSLADALREDPDGTLGPGRGAEMPFLLKVLAIEQPLSIQAHPDAAQAAAGFQREEALGVPRDAATRNYPDDRPKPEIVYALTPFTLLRGFRPPAEILALGERLGLAELLPECELLEPQDCGHDGLQELVRVWMGLERRRLDELIPAVARRAAELDGEAFTWIRRLAELYPGDCGVLGPLFLHLLKLSPGQAIFTGPGVLHAYLGGLGVELMTSSDNVLRGGLTSKHRDPDELLAILRFTCEPPVLLEPTVLEDAALGAERRFSVPSADFVLSVLELVPGGALAAEGRHGVEVLLCTDGAGTVRSGELVWPFRRGDAFLVPAAVDSYTLTGEGRLFRAGVRP